MQDPFRWAIHAEFKIEVVSSNPASLTKGETTESWVSLEGQRCYFLAAMTVSFATDRVMGK